MKKIMLLIMLQIINAGAQNLDPADIFSYEKNRYLNFNHYGKVLYPGDSTIDVTYYKLNLEITWRPDYLKGEVLITAKSLVTDLSSFFIDLSSNLTVDSILHNANHLLYTHNNDIINIILFSPLNIYEELNFSIYYSGTPGADGRSFTFGEHNGMPSIYTLSEPYGASEWWPCKDTPADKSDSSDVWITVREDLTAVSNGLLTEVINNGNTKTFKWKNSYPIAHYLISLAVSNYVEYTQYFHYPFNNLMPVVHYIYPENLETVKPELDKTLNMLNIFSDLFGLYPFIDEKYGHAEFGWGGGMEHQTISSMGAFNENIISHELAHQWFGDKITCRDWHNIWLNEGFATYASALYYEKAYGSEAYKNYISVQTANAKRAEGTLFVQDISSISQIFDGLRSYSKGAMVLHMLRGVTGDSLFFRILKEYADHPSVRYGTAVTEDFQKIAESVYGESLEYFFDQWVYGVNFPEYKAGWDYKHQGNNEYIVSINLEQQVNVKPLFFTMPLEVRIKTAEGDTTIIIFNNQQVQQFEVTINGKPFDLIIDPDNYILKEIHYILSGNPNLPTKYELSQNYPNPFKYVTFINFSIPVNEQGETSVKIKLYDIMGNEISIIYDNMLAAGRYSIPINSLAIRGGLSSGIYIYTLEAGGKFFNGKVNFIK